MYKEIFMKQLFAIVLASFALTTFAAEPAQPAEKPKTEMKLAKKKKDKEAEKKAATKSDKKTADKKAK
jgi:hypothetical protein